MKEETVVNVLSVLSRLLAVESENICISRRVIGEFKRKKQR